MPRHLATSAFSLGILLACAGGESPPASADADAPAFHARGNEPAWRLDVRGGQLTLVTQEGERVVAAVSTVQRGDTTTRYEGGELTASLLDQLCHDSMTGMPYPSTVEVVFGGRKLSGCGGDPASLLQGPAWVVEEIAGAGLVEGSRATLAFGADGRVGGSSSCNTYGAQYTLTGEGLSVSQAAGTMMACTPALMSQEGSFLDVLQHVRRFDLSADGALILEAGDRRTITARR